MSKKMEVVVSDEEYDWMSKFADAEDFKSTDIAGALNTFSKLITYASFTDIGKVQKMTDDEKVHEVNGVRVQRVYGRYVVVDKDFTSYVFSQEQEAVIEAIARKVLEAQHE